MLAIAYYFLKVIIFSGILYGYYHIALRNKLFHHWNRFYLLMIVVASVIIPLIRINGWGSAVAKTSATHLIQIVSSSDEYVYNYSKSGFHLDFSSLYIFLFGLVSCIMLTLVMQALLKIRRLKSIYPAIKFNGVNFRNTKASGTPFSFFNNIFWNDEIDINSTTGRHIFQHELTHVHEKHSHDKIFINLALVVGWFNPFFWLVRKELNMIHEFIADKRALHNMDTSAFAAMILQATYPNHQLILTNNFFYSPLKRRINMLTKKHNAKIGYIGRLLVLPLAAILFFAFTMKMQKHEMKYHGKPLTVVIDAGHGGTDAGAMSTGGIREKEITLAISKKIAQLNTNENIIIYLSRKGDEILTPKERINYAKMVHADLFISIHLDAVSKPDPGKPEKNGLNVFVPSDQNEYVNQSKMLGSTMIDVFKNNTSLYVNNNLLQLNKGVWVLRANEFPAIIMEPGFLSSSKDIAYLIKASNQEIIASNILKGIENYAISKPVTIKTVETIVDSVPKTKLAANPLFIVDGVERGKDMTVVKDINPNSISSINVLKNEAALKKYGEKGRDGVIEIFTKKLTDKEKAELAAKTEAESKDIVKVSVNGQNMPVGYTTKPDKVFTKVEHPAEFPGGEIAWHRYMEKIMSENNDALIKNNVQGTCVVTFIVMEDGSVSDVKATTLANTKLAEVAIDAIKKGPKWNPATQNGHIVNSIKEVPVSFKVSE